MLPVPMAQYILMRAEETEHFKIYVYIHATEVQGEEGGNVCHLGHQVQVMGRG
jgi:hypothetical protein